MDRTAIFSFIAGQRLAVISTVHPSGGPEAALIGFGFDPVLGIVFDTLATARKARNLRARPAAALVIGWDDETTVQIEGLAHEPTGDDLARAKPSYFSAWPDGREREASPGIAYFILRPSWLRYCCFGSQPIITEFHLDQDRWG